MFKILFCEEFIQSVPVICQTTAGVKYSIQTTEKEKSPILGSLILKCSHDFRWL